MMVMVVVVTRNRREQLEERKKKLVRVEWARQIEANRVCVLCPTHSIWSFSHLIYVCLL